MIWLKLLGVLGWLKKALTALLGLARSYPLQAALIASLCLSGWLWHGKNVQHAGWVAEIAGRIADRKAYEAANAANLAAQIAQNKAWEAKSTEAAKEADYAYIEGRQAGLAAASAYADSHRVRPDQVRSSTPASPGESAAPQSGDGAGAETDMVAITPADLEICTINSLRLEAVHAWGEDLRAKGIAESAP